MFVTCLFTISAGEDANSRMKTHFINKITFYNHGTISSKYDQSMPPAVNVNNLVLVIYCWHIWQEILILVVNEMQRYYKPHSVILTGHIIDHMKNIMNRFSTNSNDSDLQGLDMQCITKGAHWNKLPERIE